MDALTTQLARAPETSTRDAWGVRWRPVPDARLRLFCLPHAGGGAVTYRLWAQYLASDIEVVAVRLPGRETRHRERPFTCMDDLVRELLRGLTPFLDRPHAWFGHSLGALIAFEVCRELSSLGLAQPTRLLVSGRPAPHLTPRQPPVHAAPTEQLLDRLREMDGTPSEILNDPQAISDVLPTLRADLAVAETYRCRPGPPLSCPISVFGGSTDRFATSKELHAWRDHSTAECRVRVFGGGHFYLHAEPAAVLRAVGEDLSPPQWRIR
jgi:surfactin synthase thioesterase subunit